MQWNTKVHCLLGREISSRCRHPKHRRHHLCTWPVRLRKICVGLNEIPFNSSEGSREGAMFSQSLSLPMPNPSYQEWICWTFNACTVYKQKKTGAGVGQSASPVCSAFQHDNTKFSVSTPFTAVSQYLLIPLISNNLWISVLVLVWVYIFSFVPRYSETHDIQLNHTIYVCNQAMHSTTGSLQWQK